MYSDIALESNELDMAMDICLQKATMAIDIGANYVENSHVGKTALNVATEGLGVEYEYSEEGIGEFISKMWEGIKNIMSKIWENIEKFGKWIVGRVKALMGKTDAVEKKAEALGDQETKEKVEDPTDPIEKAEEKVEEMEKSVAEAEKAVGDTIVEIEDAVEEAVSNKGNAKEETVIGNTLAEKLKAAGFYGSAGKKAEDDSEADKKVARFNKRQIIKNTVAIKKLLKGDRLSKLADTDNSKKLMDKLDKIVSKLGNAEVAKETRAAIKKGISEVANGIRNVDKAKMTTATAVNKVVTNSLKTLDAVADSLGAQDAQGAK